MPTALSLSSRVPPESRTRLEQLAEQLRSGADFGAQDYAAQLTAATGRYAIALGEVLARSTHYPHYRQDLQALTAEFRRGMQEAGRRRRRAGADWVWSRWEERSLPQRQVMKRGWDATVQPAALLADIVAVLRRGEPIALREGEFGTVAVRTGEALGRSPAPPPADFHLTGPYDLKNSWTRRTSPALLASGVADPSDGSVEVESALAEVGLCVAQASVGSCIRLPSGFSQVRVRARLRTDWATTAESLLAPASSLLLKRVELLEVGGLVQAHSELIGGVWAPLVWCVSDRQQGVHWLDTTFPIPRAGGDFAVRAGVESHSFVGGAVGAARGDVAATVEEISLEVL